MPKVVYNYLTGFAVCSGFDGMTVPKVVTKYGAKVEYYPYTHGISHSFDLGDPLSANIILVGDGICRLTRKFSKIVLDNVKDAMLQWGYDDFEVVIEPRRQMLFSKGRTMYEGDLRY